jgi:hypothetical protein
LRLKSLLPLIMVCVLSTLPVVAQEAAPPASALLQFKYKAGDIDRYKMVVKFEMNIAVPGMAAAPGGGAMQANMSMVSVLRSKVLGILPNGNAKIRYAYESMKMDMDMPGMPAIEKGKMDQMQNDMVKQMPVITATVTKYGQIVGFEGVGNMPGLKQGADLEKLFGGQMGFGLGTGSVVFPADPVSVGDAWSQDIPIMGAGKMTVDSTVDSLNTKIGSRVAAKIKQDYYGHMNLGDLMKAMLPAMGGGSNAMPAMDGGMDMSGWGIAYVDAARGKLVRSDADVDMVMKMTATPPAGSASAGGVQSLNIDMTMNMKINIINMGG